MVIHSRIITVHNMVDLMMKLLLRVILKIKSTKEHAECESSDTHVNNVFHYRYMSHNRTATILYRNVHVIGLGLMVTSQSQLLQQISPFRGYHHHLVYVRLSGYGIILLTADPL